MRTEKEPRVQHYRYSRDKTKRLVSLSYRIVRTSSEESFGIYHFVTLFGWLFYCAEDLQYEQWNDEMRSK